MGSHNCGGWQVPRSVVGKLDTQESWWHWSSVQASRLKTQEKPICQFRSEGRKRPKFQLKGSQVQEFPFLSFIVLFRPSTDLMWPTHIGRAICFSQITDSNLISSRNTLTDLPRTVFNWISGPPVAQSSWPKMNLLCLSLVSPPSWPERWEFRLQGILHTSSIPTAPSLISVTWISLAWAFGGEETTHGELLSCSAMVIWDQPAPSSSTSWPQMHEWA